jgi:hypothetical protein
LYHWLNAVEGAGGGTLVGTGEGFS